MLIGCIPVSVHHVLWIGGHVARDGLDAAEDRRQERQERQVRCPSHTATAYRPLNEKRVFFQSINPRKGSNKEASHSDPLSTQRHPHLPPPQSFRTFIPPPSDSELLLAVC